jgi:carboxylate-amine ligase
LWSSAAAFVAHTWHVRTFGVEEEFLIVDPDNGSPVPLADEVLRLHGDGHEGMASPFRSTLAVELQQEQLEVITSPHSSLRTLAAEVRAGRTYADSLARKAGARIAALATSPVAVTPHASKTERYDALLEKFALTAREQLTCGYHVHVSVDSDEEGVAVLDRIRSWLPALTALSSNSPFWSGADSGYASFRTQAWDRWSSAGPTDVFGSAAAYHSLVADLSGTGVVMNPDFDARLSARHPTVEIRVSDVCLDARDTILIAALIRALVETAAREWNSGQLPDMVSATVLRQATWRASRFGLNGELLDPKTHKPATAKHVLAAFHSYVRDALEETGDASYAREGLLRIFSQGTGAARQRQAHERTGSLAGVVAYATGVTHLDPVDHPHTGEPDLASDPGTAALVAS